MRHIKAIKYYSYGKYSNPEQAQTVVDELSEKHPERSYTILMNMRSYYKRYLVVQCKPVAVNWPSDDDLLLPPRPLRPAHPRPGGPMTQAEQDWKHEMDRRERVKDKALAPLKKILHEKLNS